MAQRLRNSLLSTALHSRHDLTVQHLHLQYSIMLNQWLISRESYDEWKMAGGLQKLLRSKLLLIVATLRRLQGVYGPRRSTSSPVLSSDGSALLSDKPDI